MQAAKAFGRRGVTREPQAAPPVDVAQAPSPVSDDSLADAGLRAFQAAARADWAQARTERPRIAIWKRYPGMTALAVMAVVFALITVTPLHLSLTALRWIRGGLGVGGVFGFGAKRLFRKTKRA